MATYVISDIHGCYNEFIELLDRIGFSLDDELFVLGDAMDRGPEPIKVIQDLMKRENAYYIRGNHDEMMLTVLQRLMVEINEENANKLTADDLIPFYDWIQNGGNVTLQQYRKLSDEQQADIRDYLECSAFYESIECDGKLYIMTHAGIDNFVVDKELDEYDPVNFLWSRPDYSRKYFPGDKIFLVSGHTPTPLIREDQCPLVYQANNHIALDCGAVFGGNLAAYCIETGAVTYVSSKKEKTNENHSR